MTLIDVDGYLAPDDLAVLGAAEAARAIRRLDIGGSIGIDFPTVGGKAARQAAAQAIDAALPQPFERTAVNGFGFIQIVRPRRRASLVELAQDRATFEARSLLRRAAFEGPGPKRLVGPSALIAVLEAQPDWLEALSRQVGGPVGLRARPQSSHVGRICRNVLTIRNPARSAGNLKRPSTRLSAAAAARIAICSSGSARVTALPVRPRIPRGWTAMIATFREPFA